MDRQATWNGFGNGMSRSFELAVAPAIFALFGLMVDRWLGTVPVFTVVLAVLAMVGGFLRTYYEYQAAMEREDAQRPWGKANRRP